jgi:hypothetical protein
MRKRAEGRRHQGLPDQRFRTCNVSRTRGRHFIENAADERARQPTLHLDGPRIERQCALE